METRRFCNKKCQFVTFCHLCPQACRGRRDSWDGPAGTEELSGLPGVWRIGDGSFFSFQQAVNSVLPRISYADG